MDKIDMAQRMAATEGKEHAVTFGLTASALLVLVFGFVWSDNRHGFREAGAFADLLAALFSSIATVWLIVAVFRQGHELRLQREELALQRDQLEQQARETRRLADYNEDLAEVSEKQREIASKQYVLSEARALVNGNYPWLHDFYNAAVMSLMNEAGEMDHYGQYPFEKTKVTFEKDGLRLVYNLPGQPDQSKSISKRDMYDRLPRPSALKTMAEMRDTAEAAGMGDWFRTRLPWLLESQIDPEEISFFFDFLPVE